MLEANILNYATLKEMTVGNSYGLEIYYLVCVDKNRPQRIYLYKYITYIEKKRDGDNIV